MKLLWEEVMLTFWQPSFDSEAPNFGRESHHDEEFTKF
jgi:hypothetical protein